MKTMGNESEPEVTSKDWFGESKENRVRILIIEPVKNQHSLRKHPSVIIE